MRLRVRNVEFFAVRLFAMAAVLAACFQNFAIAQTVPDQNDTVVVTATRVPTEIEKIPAGVTVIDRTTIEQRGYTSLVDALAAVPGLRVVQSGGPGSVASVFIRGTNSNQVLVLRDGVPVNDPGDPGGLFNFGVDSLGDIERIEVVRGPMSSVYGSGAIGGVINLITRHGNGTLHGSAVLGGGFPRQGLLQGEVSGHSGIWDFAANAEGQSIRGFDQTPQRETPVFTNEADGDRSKLAQVEIGATPVHGTRVSLLLRGRDAKYGYDDQNFVTFDHGNATGYDSSLFGRLGVTSSLFGNFWTTSAYLTRLQDDRRYTVGLTQSDPNQDEGDSRYHGRRTDAQWNNTLHFADAEFLAENSITFGYEHSSDQSHTRINTSSGGFAYDSATIAHADSDAGWLGAQTTLFHRLTATGQLREDATTLAGDAFTWRVGGVLDLPEILSHAKASYGTGFRAPALFDRYGIDSFGYVGNKLLRPERSQGYEVGITTDVPIGADSASVSLTYFDNRLRDLIELVFFPVYTSVNAPHARTHGVEAGISVKIASWLQADFGYTYTEARNLDTGERLRRRPLDQGSANFRIAPFPGFVISPEFLYVGQTQDFLTDNSGVPFGVGPLRAGFLVNLAITWQASPRVQVFVTGKNLGDSTFEPASGYQTPGSSVLAGTRLRF